MALSVERICNELHRKGLLSPADIRNLRLRWLREAGASAADPVMFVKWLTHQGQVTDYQANVLLRRRDDPLVLGAYKIRGRIGRGRMAGVYEAVHPGGQAVAIKVLPPARAADPTVLARFQREARLAMRLRHPNVICTFQAGEHQRTHFLVMELLRGETLKDVLLRRGRLPAAEAMRLIYQALQGLQHVHEQGMVHRDLEPANLMLLPGRADQAETTLNSAVKILDIGLGRTVFDEGAPGSGPIHLTSASDQLGTPLYCAPEQSKDAREADIRSDIYSLGCVLFHTLTGQPPFEDRGAVRLVLSHATEPPPRLAIMNLGVPEGLQAILDSMLAKDPALRFPTPGHAAQELRQLLTLK
ncbi:MAG TPA: serine/threonine-protein kinase [Gemmataceae bacterium]|nr:serine/threonine-protein kinase [Gemmataceae bacterium]